MLLAFFSKWPELFKQGRIRFVKTPIVIMEKGKQVKWFYDLTEYEAEKHKYTGWTERYIKGLGSLREYEYKQIIREPKYDVVHLDDNYVELFELLFGEDSDPRKVWMTSE